MRSHRLSAIGVVADKTGVCIGKTPFTINHIAEGFLGVSYLYGWSR
jgi:hypothetical protein